MITIARSDGTSKVVAGYSGAVKSTNNSVNVDAPMQVSRHSSTAKVYQMGSRVRVCLLMGEP